MVLRVRILLALWMLAAIAGCGRSGALDGFGGGLPTPRLPGQDPTPTPTPGMPAFGDGHDGPLTVEAPSVVNHCAEIVSGSGGSVTLENVPPEIGAGDVVLLWQVQDAFATVSSPADITDAGGAGAWELTRVQSIAGNTLSVAPAIGTYVSAGAQHAQACDVPEFTDVVIESGQEITASTWTGTVGGVIAFYASGTVTVTGDVVADERGFRGGVASIDSGTTNFALADSTNAAEGGGKGEGLDIRGLGRFARGNFANGAGGGNARNAGGGGGGNAGAGGRGGLEITGQGDDATSQGEGGAAVVLPDALVMGGGGGGAHQDDGNDPDGGPGGGVILMRVRILAGDGAITANGGDGARATPSDDGGGGGGAGGTIDLLFENALAFDGDVSAAGGDGASTLEIGGSVRHGPGGGGGGGMIRRSGALGGAAVLDVSGGAEGECNGDARNALPGGAGLDTVN